MEIAKYLRANQACTACIQLFTAFTHAADLLGRIAHHQGVIRNIFRDHRPGADESVTTDGMAADDRSVGSDSGALLDKGGAHLVHFGDFRAGVEDVGEDHRGSTEDAVFEGHAFIDRDVVLELAFVTDGYIRANDDVLADVAVLTNLSAGEDVGEVPDLCAFADLDVIIDNGGWVDEDSPICFIQFIVFLDSRFRGNDRRLGKNRGAVPHFSFFLFKGVLAEL